MLPYKSKFGSVFGRKYMFYNFIFLSGCLHLKMPVSNHLYLAMLLKVGKHPDFRKSRCLFIVRTNGETEDFSYRKCIKEYIKQKYPSQADDFIQNHLTRQFTRRPK
jgi:hypothetical protein